MLESNTAGPGPCTTRYNCSVSTEDTVSCGCSLGSFEDRIKEYGDSRAGGCRQPSKLTLLLGSMDHKILDKLSTKRGRYATFLPPTILRSNKGGIQGGGWRRRSQGPNACDRDGICLRNRLCRWTLPARCLDSCHQDLQMSGFSTCSLARGPWALVEVAFCPPTLSNRAEILLGTVGHLPGPLT